MSAAAERNSKRLPTRPQAAGIAAEHAVEQLVLVEVQRRIVGQFAAQEGLLPIAADGRSGRSRLWLRRTKDVDDRPQPRVGVLLGGNHLLLDGREVLRQGIEILRHHLAELADARAERVVLLGMRSRSLVMAGTRASLRASIDLSLASNCSSFSATGRTADLSAASLTPEPPPSPPAAAAAEPPRGTALANWSILP